MVSLCQRTKGQEVFVHCHALQRAQRLEAHGSVQYYLSWNAKKGKYQAAGVSVTNHSQLPAAVEEEASATASSSQQLNTCAHAN